MKRLTRSINVFVLGAILTITGLRASASEAISLYTGGGSIAGFVNGGAGFGFSPLTDIYVSSLGFNGSILSSENYSVTLWNSSGSALATGLITSGSPLINQTRYQSISPLALSSGETYYLQAIGVSSGVWAGNVIVADAGESDADVNGTFMVAPEISYLHYALGTTGAGTFPATLQPDASARIYMVGPNFQYVVPEPSTFSLAALGLALLAFARRRSRH